MPVSFRYWSHNLAPLLNPAMITKNGPISCWDFIYCGVLSSTERRNNDFSEHLSASRQIWISETTCHHYYPLSFSFDSFILKWPYHDQAIRLSHEPLFYVLWPPQPLAYMFWLVWSPDCLFWPWLAFRRRGAVGHVYSVCVFVNFVD